MTTKQEYEDDPQAYWELKRDREDQDGKDKLDAWEKQYPHLPYGFRIPNERD
jgi:hypothetical protein